MNARSSPNVHQLGDFAAQGIYLCATKPPFSACVHLFRHASLNFPVASLLHYCCTAVLDCTAVSTQGSRPGRIVEVHLPQLALGPTGEGSRGGLTPRESGLREVAAHKNANWNDGMIHLSDVRLWDTEGKSRSFVSARAEEEQEEQNLVTAESSPASPAVATPAHGRGGGGGGGGGGRRGRKGAPRHLQDESCELAADFTLSNTDYSAAGGCYSVVVDTDPYVFTTPAFDGVFMRSTYLTDEYDVSL